MLTNLVLELLLAARLRAAGQVVWTGVGPSQVAAGGSLRRVRAECPPRQVRSGAPCFTESGHRDRVGTEPALVPGTLCPLSKRGPGTRQSSLSPRVFLRNT